MRHDRHDERKRVCFFDIVDFQSFARLRVIDELCVHRVCITRTIERPLTRYVFDNDANVEHVTLNVDNRSHNSSIIRNRAIDHDAITRHGM